MVMKFYNHKRKSNRLEFDRKDSTKGYSPQNLVLSCHICNNHKKDFFSVNEFLEITKKIIKPKIKSILEDL